MPQDERNDLVNLERKSAYCEFLGIAIPSIDAYIDHRNAKPIQLFALAILTHSRPMTIEEVADYLVARGWNPPTGNPVLSLKKSFAGRLPLVQLPDGKIDVDSLNFLCRSMSLRSLRFGGPERVRGNERPFLRGHF